MGFFSRLNKAKVEVIKSLNEEAGEQHYIFIKQIAKNTNTIANWVVFWSILGILVLIVQLLNSFG